MKTATHASLKPEMQYIIDCINSIDEKYYKEDITKLQNGALVPTGRLRANESTYVTQLINKIEAVFKEHSIHVNGYYQTDAPKQLIFKEDNYRTKYKWSIDSLFQPVKTEDDEFSKIPDIVVHYGSNDINPENQIFLSEIKTTFQLTQNQFDIDLFKVNVYHEELNFKNSAFIIINSTVDNVKSKFDSYKTSNYFQTNKEGIYIVVKPSYNESIAIFNIGK